jgi:AcrR family transcriptional regulator
MILLAAEFAFSEHGFAGARVDAIAQFSGYNKTLIFRYYGDKLGLYTEVLRRADEEISELMAQVLTPLFEDEQLFTQAGRFRDFLKTMIQALFDYLLKHPRLVRILTWEMAERWETFTLIASEFPPESVEHFELLFQRAYQAGLLRSDFQPAIQFGLLLQVCQTYIASLPMYKILLQTEDLSSTEACTSAQEYIVNMLVHGMMADPETMS